MTHHPFLKRFAPLLLVFIILLLGAGSGWSAPPPQAQIDPRVWSEFSQQGQADVIIVLDESADLTQARLMTDGEARARFVYDASRAVAERSQSRLLAALDQMHVPYRRFWLINAVQVRVTPAQLDRIMALGGIRRVVANLPFRALPAPIDDVDLSVLAAEAAEWGVSRVNAPWAWNQGYTGQGVVVSGQDTGYDWDHEALLRAYRGYDPANPTQPDHNYNWHDAIHEDIGSAGSNSCGYDVTEPCDDQSHGTHTMGTMVGNDGDPSDPNWPAGSTHVIGVAPGAAWIGCRNMDEGDGIPSTYIECFEWLAAPYPIGGDPMTQGDPTKKPDVMNNSWGCPESEGCTADVLDIIEPSMNAAIDAGILVVVSAGNAGSACNTVQDPPAIYPRSFAVGATTNSDALADFSSRGDVTYGGETFMKPNISAPGYYIYSSTPNDNYSYMSGTSMAGPHVAGVAALLLSAEPSLKGQPEMTQAILERTADAMVDNTCGGAAGGHPNNGYGWGIANAQAAIESLSQQATLNGIVTDGLTTAAVQGATVTLYALSDTSTPVDSTTTAADGSYAFNISWGSYRIIVSKAGYESTTVEPIYVVGGQTSTVDVVLNPKPAAVSADLSIEAVDGDVVLHWRHVDDTVMRYEIWRSPSPYPDRLNADASKIGEVTPGALNEMLSFTDPNSTLNDPAVESAYVIYAVNSLEVFSDVDHSLGEREYSLIAP